MPDDIKATESQRAEAKNILDAMIVMDRLEKAYNIIAEFEEIINREFVEKQNAMPLTSDYQALGSALGYIGSALDAMNCGDVAADGQPFKKLVVTAPKTRREISEAYQALEMIQENLKSESSLGDPIAFLKSCLYALSDKCYRADEELQNAIGNILEICDCGIETIDTVEAIPESDCLDQYLNPSGQTLHARLPQLRSLFEGFRPKYENIGE